MQLPFYCDFSKPLVGCGDFAYCLRPFYASLPFPFPPDPLCLTGFMVVSIITTSTSIILLLFALTKGQREITVVGKTRRGWP